VTTRQRVAFPVGRDVFDNPSTRATIGDQLRRHAINQPETLAIAYFDEHGDEIERLSYAELNERVNRIANSLADLGVERGDVVGVLSRNSLHYVSVYLAAAKLGAVTTGINHNFRPAEMEYQLAHAEPRVLVVEPVHAERLAELGDALDAIEIRIWAPSDGARIDDPRPGERWSWLEDLYGEDSSPDEPESAVVETDVLFLIYTSGTEAFPKAVMIPHRNYPISTVPAWAMGAPSVDDDLSGGIVRTYDRWLFLTPLHTIAGLGNFTIVLSVGASIIMPRTVNTGLAISLCEQERVTAMVQTPTFFLGATQHEEFESADLSSVERLLTYGGTMPRSMFDAWAAKSPRVKWSTYWGQSELTQLGTMGWFRSITEVPGGDMSWIGRPVPQLEIMLVDEEGNAGNEGEAWCRSPSVMLGYFKDPERTQATMADGWLRTGDIMRRDAQGQLFFLDRRKDMIKSGGYNVSSQEVERMLYGYPGIAQVAVVGVADEKWSEAVTAFVVPAADADLKPAEMIAYCKERLVNYKVPKTVHLVDALPVDAQGKILKRELRRIHGTQSAG
jgi:acyl-CoA synthetase (AMP-forming)/AMP-acid ligase II